MAVKLPLKDMTILEKLEMMETLWDDLSSSPEVIESPEWHKKLLAERRSQVEDGTSRLKDWDTAKSDIRKKLQ